MQQEPLLSVRNLTVQFKTDTGTVKAVDDISFDIFKGETVGLVGESGCGKSMTSLALLGLIPKPNGSYGPKSQIIYKGKNLAKFNESSWRKLRGKELSMIFQEPMTALNPVFTVRNQMTEVILRHKVAANKKAAVEVAIGLLEKVGIPSPEKRVHDYPHQLSGGMRQRVMIAMALAAKPGLLLADEPTTALDVTTQAQVMEQLSKLQNDMGMTTLLVTHDLGGIAENCQRVIVMYCGKIIETASVTDLFANPQHPYTKGLLESIPKVRDKKIEVLPTIEGTVPDIKNLPKGCRFADRCVKQTEQCLESLPQLKETAQSRQVACFHPVQ